MKKYTPSFLIIATSVLCMAGSAFADEVTGLEELSEHPNSEKTETKSFFTPNFTYWDTSVNYLNWSQGTEDRSSALNGPYGLTDFVYLELEGGAGWDWGEFYFFSDVENPGHSWEAGGTDNSRFVFKPILDIKLGDTNWYVHLQDYYLRSDTFFVNNLVTGLAYKYTYGDFWIRPFIGPHIQHSTYYDGFNGYMAGWTFIYNFKIGEQKLMLSNWHEFEFDRDEEHYLFNGEPTGDGRSYGTNGAIALWWTPTKAITTGIQYRYADYKLGVAAYTTAVIYSLKYNF